MARITVGESDKGRFSVVVEHDGRTFAYQVGVPAALAARLGAEPATVARATLAFLLDREPPSAVMASFDCSVVSRYFPEYEAELPGYLSGPGARRRSAPTLGLDLGGTKVQAVVLDGDGAVAGQARSRTPTVGGPAEVVDAIVEAARGALNAAKADPGDLVGVGIGTPGGIDQATGSVHGAANLPGFGQPVPLRELVGRALEVKRVAIDNDVNAGTAAEHRLGAGRGFDDLLAVFAGSGVGGAVVLGGELRRGVNGSAGEIGHMVAVLDGEPCPCGRRGCVEAYAGRVAIERRARAAAAAGRRTALLDLLAEQGKQRMTSGIVAAALAAGDGLASELIDDAVAALAAGIGSAVNLLDVEAVVLGGGLADKLGAPFTERVRQALLPRLFVQPPKLELTAATLGDLGGAIGAALLVAKA